MVEGVERFVAAQDAGGAYGAALGELRAGRKRGHWIWFVLPQVEGLGSSGMSQRYGLRGLDEAGAYLAHPVLGPRLLACVEALLAVRGSDAEAVLGAVDAMKLRSSMTVFSRAAEGEDAAPFRAVLDRFFEGAEDPRTVALL
ncbi:DUF1810 domain-containing protein [Phycicoccus duodecadis]|uniref:Uncharacterized protein (DUF1810 family) n=1 Tax=Phycicoccus duodecadis TaxID=173053 RepID=A0A2N3YGY7_9MICO|nr:DUF1810 domain-containing protein [Phycicoccus duodecadis]PKW26125.1 uncharacterized protein (DUF1810 family) [Phycicoccus duodecadis]